MAGVVMYLHLVSDRGGSLLARRYVRDVGKALAAAERLESAGLRPNVVRSGPNYMVNIATADLLRLAEEDDAVRRAIALHLAEKVKNGTPRQREVARKLLQRHPFFKPWLAAPIKPIIVPSHRIKPPHATGDLCQNIERSRYGRSAGILGAILPGPPALLGMLRACLVRLMRPWAWASYR